MQAKRFVHLAVAATMAVTMGAAMAHGDHGPEQRPAMLDEWTGPHGGVPAWDKVVVSEFVPAFEIAMNEQRAQIEAIANNAEKPNFANTILAMEKAGGALDRLFTYYGVHAGTLNVGDMPKIQQTLAPKFAAFQDEITQNEKLFKRIEAVYNSKEKAKLTPEEQRLTWLYYTRFVRAGAKLDEKQKAKLSEINQRLATLYTQFSQNTLDDENNQFTVIDSKDDLKGLPDDYIAAAAAAAEARDMKGKWVINNTRSAMEPFLTNAANRELREKVWNTYYNRGDMGGATDNNALITEILQLRFQRAQLLGYKTHAHWRLEPQMAGTPDRAVELMEAMWKPAAAAVKRDVAEMQKLIDAEGGKFKLKPWDYRYYAEKLRKAKYDLDFSEVKPYMQMDKLRDGMFWSAAQLYDLHFTLRPDIKTYHPDVTAWEVKNGKGGHVGLWYFDPYARQGKRSGAWMNAYRGQENLDNFVTPIVSNNSNFLKGQPGEPVLISWDDAETMFHEFGHALHGLLSNVKYPTLAGTATARDFVEFPSQINEHWLSTPEVLNQFALHYQTGKPIPAELVEKIDRAQTFNEGFRSMEYLASAMIDMKLHLAGGKKIDPDKFEREELKKLGLPEEIVMRHRTPHFGHVFAGDGYSAGYYSYLWSDSLTADAWEAFMEGKGPWDKEVAQRFVKTILSAGNTKDQAEMFREFRGRDVKTDALMRKRGFDSSK
ncbi:M3 family metallopeptidase [Permianibacter aggregans]|uniref:Peptidyl-dipeptidase Dcp n=1 Tax=Permianibacter aggregans TaxID=1510150 RepID=A0A4R6UP77_9GAMM|nr:M3 family metallopeptidase [Permianibacter aggregans]QGX38332.1 M3 family peptidase [Permianibacter aggregans]TDQ48652.1 peptidyl-dipeptidase Dcp [Permianibacter aggregans]